MNHHYDMKQEIELKLDLGSFTNYLKLVGFLGQVDREDRQINCFFDTESHDLLKDGWALRVRLEEETGIVTLKGQASEDDRASIRRELEQRIAGSEASEVIELRCDVMSLEVEPVMYVRQHWPNATLTRLAHFENVRQRKSFKLGDYTYDLEIDTTSFLDGSVDYELEVELAQEDQIEVVNDGLQKLFASLDIPFHPQSKTKFQRALERSGVA